MEIRYVIVLILTVLVAGCWGGERETIQQNMDHIKELELVDYNFSEMGAGKLEETYKNNELESKIFAYEKRFSQNNYKGAMGVDDQVGFIAGSEEVNVLISAPHTTRHVRDKDLKAAEINTGAMAHLIQEYTGAHLIFNTHKGEDANDVLGGKYKEKIGEIIEEHTIGLVIDLHGQDRSFDVDIGTDDGDSVREEWVRQLYTILHHHGIEHVYENHTFSASHPVTVTHHTWNEYGIEAMQLEINSDFRDPDNNLKSFYDMLSSLVIFVENVE
ncbi:hypothetical protein CR194_13135 [Salipaludibacillus keqinensis]|uniref:Stage II sporulation protein P n=1 Tax=Salipaludibacillus keqinensis TaxID=2045207 RepID=A0A323TC70_9BACI|nr:N-formylglutamate amidohydrolase [Salipaludibacillus keqinensis]PYZ92609.1 hypothetical protein CR194_13135 [Salipaludibacillus keqinensis]